MLGLGYLLAYFVEQHYTQKDTSHLAGKMDLARSAVESLQDQKKTFALKNFFDESLAGDHGISIAISDMNGNVFFEHGKAVFRKNELLNRAYGEVFEWSYNGVSYRGVLGKLTVEGRSVANPSIIAVGTEITDQLKFMSFFRMTVWLFVCAATVLIVGLGWISIVSALSPLAAINRDASSVTASKLNHRLPIDDIPLEFRELASTINKMLERLEESFLRLSDFSSDLAHELRTPISNLMLQTQVSLSKDRTPEDYREILSSNAEELERMARAVSDMLFLAKSDNGLMTTNIEKIDLHTEIVSLFEFYEALAEVSDVKLELHGDGSVDGDKLMLRRALSNLLSNAVRYADRGSRVTVSIVTGVKYCCVNVTNTGPEIPSEHIPRLFDRFFRSDASRHHSTEGAGLGLSITKSIVYAHSGFIEVESSKVETRFSVNLPFAQALHHSRL